MQITFQYENDLLEELAFKFFDYDGDCLANNAHSDSAVVNNIQAKLLRMENAYAKRVKIQGICYKKKLSDFQRTIMELNRQMQVGPACVFEFGIISFLFCIYWAFQTHKSKSSVEEEKPRNIIAMEDENPRSTLVELVGQVHQMQQIVREKEMLMKRNEISSNFKVFIHSFFRTNHK